VYRGAETNVNIAARLITQRNALLSDRFDQAATFGGLEWCAATVQEKAFLRDLLVELARETRPPAPLVSTEVDIAGRLRAALDLLDTRSPDWSSIATLLLVCLQAIENSR
jgi:hypothetical protein